MHVRRILGFALAHFLVAMLIAVVAFGADMDQIRSRSALSMVAATVHDVLWAPHDAALGALPNDWLVRFRYIIPVALVLNSVAWGMFLYIAWATLRRRWQAPPPSRA
jgi:hypothetical protein